MKKINLLFILLFSLYAGACSNQASDNTSQTEETPTAQEEALVLPETNYYEIETPHGRMVVRLFDETPLHRDNFKKLVAEQAYDSTLFHRVIADFMIQGGDPWSRDDDPMNDGLGGPGHTVPAEIQPGLFHKRGMLSAARQPDNVNPDRASSGSQFYIVHGRTYSEAKLQQIAEQLEFKIPQDGFTFSDAAREAYMNEGGTPDLDGMYTVFGELVEGFDVLDSIASVETPRKLQQRTYQQLFDRPPHPIWMVMRPLPEYAE